MPSIKDIENFSKKLLGIAGEPEVLAERGEKLAQVEIPIPQHAEFTTSAGKEEAQALDSQNVSEYLEKFESADTEASVDDNSGAAGLGLGRSEIASLLEPGNETAAQDDVPSPPGESAPEEPLPPLEDILHDTPVLDEDTFSQGEQEPDLQSLFASEQMDAPDTPDGASGDAGVPEQDFEVDNFTASQFIEELGQSSDDYAASPELESSGISDAPREDRGADDISDEDPFATLFADIADEGSSATTEPEEADILGVEPESASEAMQEDEAPSGAELSQDPEQLLPIMEDQDLQEDDIQAANLASRRVELAEKKDEFAASLQQEEISPSEPEGDSPATVADSLAPPETASEDQASENQDSEDDAFSLLPKGGDSEQTTQADHTFSEEEYNAIFASLNALPFNVRKECAAFIANPDSAQEEVLNIVSLLQNKARASAIVRVINRYTGNNLVLPFGYEKSTASEYFEREKEKQRSPARRAIRRIGVTTASLVVLVGLVLGVVNFVYYPIVARILYQRGYERLEEENYVESDSFFEQAWERWKIDSWALKYARAYTDRHEYALASRKYDELVYGLDADLRDFLIEKTKEKVLLDHYAFGNRYERLIDNINVNRTAIYEHASLQSEKLKDFQRAEELLSIVFAERPYDRNALFLQGDNFIRWADENPVYLSDALRSYTLVAKEHGGSDMLDNRFAWYFAKADRLDNLLELMPSISQQRELQKSDVPIFSELAEYLINVNELFFVSDLLQRLRDDHPYVPEGHYQSARYFRIINTPFEENIALNNTVSTLSVLEPLRWEHLSMYIDTKTRIAENDYANEQLIDAERNYQEALERYVLGLETRTLHSNPEIARFYEGLGDIRYYHSKNFEEARYYYEQALAENVFSRDLSYKTGHVVFRDQDYTIAAQHFLNAETYPPREAAGLLGTASSLYHLENYSAAESYFLQLTELLEERRRTIPLFLPFEDPEHQALIFYLIQSYNGLGVTRYRIAEQNQNDGKESQAILALEQAITLFENYNRSRETFQRSIAKSLPYVNLREILYPQDSFDVEIHNTLPFYFDELLFEQFITEYSAN